MQSIVRSSSGLFLLLLLLTGIEAFIFYYLYDNQLLFRLFENDKSYVSILILTIYGAAHFHVMVTGFRFSGHFQSLAQDSREIMQQYLISAEPSITPDQEQRLVVIDTRLRSQYAFGFVIADLMLKLGLLGTVVGFIIMLGSLSNLNSVDITVMQTLLVEMSGGMKIALFTTLTGMLAGIFLNLKYHLLDWSVDHIVNDLREVLQAPARVL